MSLDSAYRTTAPTVRYTGGRPQHELPLHPDHRFFVPVKISFANRVSEKANIWVEARGFRMDAVVEQKQTNTDGRR